MPRSPPGSPKSRTKSGVYPDLSNLDVSKSSLDTSMNRMRTSSHQDSEEADDSLYRTTINESGYRHNFSGISSSSSSSPGSDRSMDDSTASKTTRSGKVYDSPDARHSIRKRDNLSSLSDKKNRSSTSFTGGTPEARPSPPPVRRQTPSSNTPPEYQPYINEAKDDPNRPISMMFFYTMGVIVVIIVGLINIMNMRHKVDQDQQPVLNVSPRSKMAESFDSSLRDLREGFPNQTRRFWATLAAPTKAVLRSESPKQPAIIVLAGSASDISTMHCLEEKLSDVISKSYKAPKGVTRLIINQDFLYLPQSELKINIDDTFKTGLENGGRVAVLRNLNKVPGKAAMMFHAYCDNESAPFKDAAIIFTLELALTDEEMLVMEDTEVARSVEDQLEDLWTDDIGIDNTMALLSRIGNNIAVVRPEKSDILIKNNCN